MKNPMLIRLSTDNDLAAVHAWLREEDSRGVYDNFLCNWTVVVDAHERRMLLVSIDEISGLPVAFQLGGLVRPGILQVREELRGTGIGKNMVEHCMLLAAKDCEPLLEIECKPETSIPFWIRMGFQLTKRENGRNHAWRVVEKKLIVPEQGTNADVVVRFFPESRDWNDAMPPYVSHYMVGKNDGNGVIYLDQRVLFHEMEFLHEGDLFVEIEVDGRRVFHDKAKRDEAEELGLIMCRNGYYIDQIAIGIGIST
jgi:GNAT superfamily N-acetyltransferase